MGTRGLCLAFPNKLRMPENIYASKTMGAKLRGQKGNSPDLNLRSLN